MITMKTHGRSVTFLFSRSGRCSQYNYETDDVLDGKTTIEFTDVHTMNLCKGRTVH